MLIISSTISFSQEVVNIPLEIDGSPFGVLNKFIMGDTTDTGERKHPDAIYRLQRGETYDCDFTLLINFNFTLIADDDDVNNPVRPPMLVRGIRTDGTYIHSFFTFVEDNLNIKFKNILFQGIRDDELIEARGPSCIRVEGINQRLEIDNCVFNGFSGNVLGTRSSASSVFILKNNIFRNGNGLESPFSGSIYGSKQTRQDSVVIINNTFFNHSSYILLSISNDLIDYAEFSHNTIFKNTVNGLWAPYLINAKMNNNLIYNYQTVAQSAYEVFSGYYDKNKHNSCIAKVYPLEATQLADWGKTEADRSVEYKNNVYAWSQEVKDYWANEKDVAHNLALIPITWMNDETNALFNDKTNYPLLVNDNNIEIDPGFDATLDEAVLAKEMPFVKLFRKYGYGNLVDPQERMYYSAPGKLYDLEWPLIENLTYTNLDVLTHAEGGFPVGDLNWYPEEKAEWEKTVGVEKDNSKENLPSKYSLSQNYPNPFNPKTNIKFSLPETSQVKIIVYNIIGKQVAELVNGNMEAGSYNIDFDGNRLSSGMYFYKIEAKNYTEIKKMMLLK